MFGIRRPAPTAKLISSDPIARLPPVRRVNSEATSSGQFQLADPATGHSIRSSRYPPWPTAYGRSGPQPARATPRCQPDGAGAEGPQEHERQGTRR